MMHWNVEHLVSWPHHRVKVVVATAGLSQPRMSSLITGVFNLALQCLFSRRIISQNASVPFGIVARQLGMAAVVEMLTLHLDTCKNLELFQKFVNLTPSGTIPPGISTTRGSIHWHALNPAQTLEHSLTSLATASMGSLPCKLKMMLLTALNQSRPVYARMEVRDTFRDYKCGVYCDDPLQRPNHAVEVVDYSNPDYTGSPYWVVKNSWGDTWGEGGYFRIARGLNQLTGFVTITASVQTSLPEATPDLTASTCDPQEPNNEGDFELIASAVIFAIERLNNVSGVQCAGDSTAVATLTISLVLNETLQVIEGFAVQATLEVNVEGCTEDTATITLTVMIDLDENFSLVDFSYTPSTTSSAKASSRNLGSLAFFTLVISVLAIFA